MSKKELILPPTKAETAEKRLEEILANKTVTRYVMIFEGENYWRYHPLNGEIRLYPDGVEMVFKDNGKPTGMLHFERRRMVIDYDLEKEYELQNGKIKEE
ncbi:MAG: hypothetical protein Q8O03_02155 [Nanoarchaeota archaeon]|nr:hypothetical protein [Nanoarchaeota archaeon]